MRDGWVAYDGPPTAAVTAPHVEHGHHHPDETRSDHVPAVASPIDRSPETAR
jgi:hypothetical protein